MAKIKQIVAKEILSGKGLPTLEVTVVLNDNAVGIASVPIGALPSAYESFNLLDHDDTRHRGLGQLNAIQMVEQTIFPALNGIEATKQQAIDHTMIDLDGTQNKAKLGANAIYAVSVAVAKAAAQSSVLPLFLYLREFVYTKNNVTKIPSPLITIFNGGGFGNGNVNFQDFLITPPSSAAYQQALELGAKVTRFAEDTLRQNNSSLLTSDQGGFVPQVPNNSDVLTFLLSSIQMASLRLGFDVFIGITASASTFYKGQQYRISDKDSGLSHKVLNDFYAELVKQYHLLYLEDGLSEDDWDGWADLYQKISQETIIAGGNLIATNPYRLQMAIDKKAISGIVVKPSQVGTVIESLAVIEVARAAGLKIIISSRNCETTDDFIADYSVAVGADYVKFGALNRGEHIQKYNRLSQIDQQLKLL